MRLLPIILLLLGSLGTSEAIQISSGIQRRTNSSKTKLAESKKETASADKKKTEAPAKDTKKTEETKPDSEDTKNKDIPAETEFDREFLKQLNKLRGEPKTMVKELESIAKEYKWKTRYKKTKDGKEQILLTSEGKKPVLGLIEKLKSQKALEPLEMDEKLREFACKHVKDQGPSSKLGHVSSDGKSLMDRYKDAELVKLGYVVGENIAYGSKTAKDVLFAMAIDDGVQRRGHRDNLLQWNFSKIGVCQGTHAMLKEITVVVFKGKAETKEPAEDDSQTAKAVAIQDQRKEQADQLARDSCSKGVQTEEKYSEFGPHQGGYMAKVEELGDQVAEKVAPVDKDDDGSDAKPEKPAEKKEEESNSVAKTEKKE